MKFIDKFLKKMNTDRNTFAAYILTLITIYLAVDRLVEMLLMIFTGVMSNYWGPIAYTFALACPVFAYAFAASSSFAKTKPQRIALFYIFVVGLYIIGLSMLMEFLNAGLWLLFMSTSSYVTIVTEFSELVKPAFCSIALYLPLVTIYPMIKFILLKVDDSQQLIKSIEDFKGISLSNNKAKHGPYACDLKMFVDLDSGKKITFAEERRFQSLLVCGSSGTGKTSMIFEPSIGQDIEKKYFFKEVSKELGYTALKTGIANIDAPYSNEYLNQKFSLNLLTPAFGKETLYDNFVKKMVLSSSSQKVYKDLGLTYMSPDYDTLSNMMQVCENYGIAYNVIDPNQPEKSIGLNPFIYDDPNKIAVIISSTLQDISSSVSNEVKDAYREEAALQVIENLSILLKVVYPQMSNGKLPNMEDLLALLNNFELVEKMCKILNRDEELASRYAMELSYFKRSFYSNGNNRIATEQITNSIASRLENLLRAPSVRAILCNRHNNLDFNKALKEGEFTFICTRRGDVGKTAHKSFGVFFLLSMQNAVLRREGNQSTRIPHFLYIDEFSDFSTQDTETMFTMYRKYKVAITISVQSITQLSNNIVLGNCGSKIFTGGSLPISELQWWSSEIGTWKQWKMSQDFDGRSGKMGSTIRSPEYKFVTKMSEGKLQSLAQNRCGYKVLDDKGKPMNGEAIMSFISSKYKEKQNVKQYDFAKFAVESNPSKEDEDEDYEDFIDIDDEYNPVKNRKTKYTFDGEGDIVIDLKNEDNN